MDLERRQPMKNIVFDCDGTIVSSHEALLLTLKQLVSEERGQEVTMNEVRTKYDADMLRCAKNFDLDVEDPARLLKRWGELSKLSARAAAYEGMSELLKTLESRGYRLLVWTGRDRASTLELLKKADLLRFFEELCCADDTTPKPHPAGLAKLLDGEDKSKCLHIGDSYTDIQGAKQYGIKSVGALWGEHAEKSNFGRFIPEYWCDKPLEILNCLEF